MGSFMEYCLILDLGGATGGDAEHSKPTQAKLGRLVAAKQVPGRAGGSAARGGTS